MNFERYFFIKFLDVKNHQGAIDFVRSCDLTTRQDYFKFISKLSRKGCFLPFIQSKYLPFYSFNFLIESCRYLFQSKQHNEKAVRLAKYLMRWHSSKIGENEVWLISKVLEVGEEQKEALSVVYRFLEKSNSFKVSVRLIQLLSKKNKYDPKIRAICLNLIKSDVTDPKLRKFFSQILLIYSNSLLSLESSFDNETLIDNQKKALSTFKSDLKETFNKIDSFHFFLKIDVKKYPYFVSGGLEALMGIKPFSSDLTLLYAKSRYEISIWESPAGEVPNLKVPLAFAQMALIKDIKNLDANIFLQLLLKTFVQVSGDFGLCLLPSEDDDQSGTREKLIKKIKPGSIGLELGVAEGDFSYRLLLDSNVEYLYSVDMYFGDRGHDNSQFKRAFKRLSLFRNRNSILKLTFEDALNFFEDCYFDFIYIDGYAHEGLDGGKVLKRWIKKVKNGGIIAGDDYDDRYPLLVENLNRVVKDMNLDLEIIKVREKIDRFSRSDSWCINVIH